MNTLFISDLHLNPEQPALTRAFQRFMSEKTGDAKALYVLGDLFESWIGDDHDSEFNREILATFRSLSERGCRIFFQHGNRDFLLGQRFADTCRGTLLPDVAVISLYGQSVLLMHGDALCTRDEKYMAFRAQVRTDAWQQMMLSKPLEERLTIAQMLRMQSKSQNANKAENIMDVTPEEVSRALQENGVNTVLHGHTHRPQLHEVSLGDHMAQRLVLGDWRDHEAVYALASPSQTLHLETFRY